MINSDNKMSLKCSECGKKIETLPLECAYSIRINSETNQWECNMENCGTIILSEFVCENCCINKNIMKINNAIEQLSIENKEFIEELGEFKESIIQTDLNNSGFKYWVKFGEGKFKYGKGEIEGAPILVSCAQKTMNRILMGNVDVFSEFLTGNLKIEGDLQYAVVYFDFIRLAQEINKEMGGAWF